MATLPSKFAPLLSGTQYRHTPNVQRTGFESGDTIQKRITTRALSTVSTAFILPSDADRDEFRDFLAEHGDGADGAKNSTHRSLVGIVYG